MNRIVIRESQTHQPDGLHQYASIRMHGHDTWKLVIGNRMVGIVFDRENPLARLNQQIYSFLDIISQALLEFNRRELRHFQDQYAMTDGLLGTTAASDIDTQVASFIDGHKRQEEVAMALLRKNAHILEYFFGFTHVEYLLSPELCSVLFYHTVPETYEFEGKNYHLVRLSMGDYPRTGFDPALLHKLEFPLLWGLHNEEHQFCMRLYALHKINPHIRRELLLNQALLKGKTELEALFDLRYRELRIAQDEGHFRRCRSSRMDHNNFPQIRQHLLNCVADYGVQVRSLGRDKLFPAYEAWTDSLANLFVDINTETLKFLPHIRMNDIREYRYVPIMAPEDLHRILLETLDPGVRLRVRSDFPVLKRFSDPEVNNTSTGSFTEKTIFFNNAVNVAVLWPIDLVFPFKRLRERFNEYLESVGEGIGRLMSYINMNSGIGNRSALTRRLDYLVPQVQYSEFVTIEISSLDIVSFKLFNELFGHPFGDRVIRHVAQELDSHVSENAYHVSGDEYYTIHCWYHHVDEDWAKTFYAERGICSEPEYRAERTELDAFVKGVPVPVPLSDVRPVPAEQDLPLGSYELCALIANFFTTSSEGKVTLKKYSRTGDDYYQVILDTDRRIQILVDECHRALVEGAIQLEKDNFRDFVLRTSTVGDKLFILPRVTIGSERYTKDTILPYASDIIEAADHAAGKSKK